MKLSHIVPALILSASCLNLHGEDLTRYVDPRIGSEGLGRVFIGPAAPFGMVRPSPDCTVAPNSGWLPMPAQVDGFAQVHVSGTGGGPKYGNILIQPFSGALDSISHISYRESETILPGYYSTTFSNNGIKTEITATHSASVYRLIYPAGSSPALAVDAGFFLGENPVPDAREAQQFVGSEVQVVSPTEVTGYSRIRGGWNNGRAYTVYFCLRTDRPAVETATWKGDKISGAKSQYDSGEKTGALLRFAQGTDTLRVDIGISFLSERKARENLQTAVSGKSFEEIRASLLGEWNALLSKIRLHPDTPDRLKRMFYTALYHTMIMPSDRTGENPLWTDPVPYYDDFYAIWDTYRTSLPLITLIDPARERDIVNSLINICRRDGFMPDARSGNANGRTQGGSNAEIVLADAFVKGLDGIDYEAALAAMRRDAEVSPGGNAEAEGRGGLEEYNRLGYVPHGIDRAGNRTVEYSYCDYAIYQVAKGLGHEETADKYLRQSERWKNLWRDGYTHDGATGFIMPRDAAGRWLDSIPYGHSKLHQPRFRYTPVTFEGPWYTPWWSMFFYEASSWEYSLSIPHDVPGLIAKCGGPEAFGRRLDKFFGSGYFNVNNEPSFLTPCLYHWIGRPDLSGETVGRIIGENYSDSPRGLPGNDDSGAMSSWLAFHITGLYPNAGQDYYLIHTPLVKSAEYELANGRKFRIEAEDLSSSRRFIVDATLDGKPYPWSAIRHADIMRGGTLRLRMGKKPGKWGAFLLPDMPALSAPGYEHRAMAANKDVKKTEGKAGAAAPAEQGDTLRFVYKLHGQTRRFRYVFTPESDGAVTLHWGIERNLKWWRGSYRMSREAVENGNSLSFLMPEDGNDIELPDNETFAMISRRALRELRATGTMTYDGVRYELKGRETDPVLGPVLRAVDAEGAELTISDNDRLPLILSMARNPLEIDWTAR